MVRQIQKASLLDQTCPQVKPCCSMWLTLTLGPVNPSTPSC